MAPTYSDAIRTVDFGETVAEHEKNLASYFVATPDFLAIAEDRHDLILGSKGSGKSAIARILVTPNYEIPELDDVDVIPAFNVAGSPFFSVPPDGLDESRFRRLWLAFFLSIAGNHLATTYGKLEESKLLREALVNAGLAYSDISSKSLWRKLTGAIRVTPEASIELSETGQPKFTGRLRAKSSAEDVEIAENGSPAWIDPAFDIGELLDSVVVVAERTQRRCWIILDRLDECFMDDPDIERIALRGLLRAHMDIGAKGSAIRVKAFLRSDIFERITRKGGFANLDHLRAIRLHWERAEIEDVLHSRVKLSPQFISAAESEDPVVLMNRLLPEKIRWMQGTKLHAVPTITWCISRSTPGRGGPTPRQVVRLLVLALQHGSNDPMNRRREWDKVEALLRNEDMMAGWHRLSEECLHSYLYAEFNEIRNAVEAFRYQKERQSWAALSSLLSSVSDNVEECAEGLIRAGFLNRVNPNLFEVVSLYCPTLDISAGVSNTPVVQMATNAELLTAYVPAKQLASEVLRTLGEARKLRDAREWAPLIDLFPSLPESADKFELQCDAAFARDDVEMIAALIGGATVLAASRDRPSLRGRIFGLGLATQNRDVIVDMATGVSHKIMPSMFAGIVSMAAGAVAKEWNIYQEWGRILASEVDSKFIARGPILAAGRVLPIARNDRSSGYPDEAVAVALDNYWNIFDQSVVRSMHGASWAYAENRNSAVPMYPYQITSVLEVLAEISALSTELERAVTQRIRLVLGTASAETRDAYSQWAPFSEVAVRVLEGMG